MIMHLPTCSGPLCMTIEHKLTQRPSRRCLRPDCVPGLCSASRVTLQVRTLQTGVSAPVPHATRLCRSRPGGGRHQVTLADEAAVLQQMAPAKPSQASLLRLALVHCSIEATTPQLQQFVSGQGDKMAYRAAASERCEAAAPAHDVTQHDACRCNHKSDSLLPTCNVQLQRILHIVLPAAAADMSQRHGRCHAHAPMLQGGPGADGGSGGVGHPAQPGSGPWGHHQVQRPPG
jgi:hypothetical protein